MASHKRSPSNPHSWSTNEQNRWLSIVKDRIKEVFHSESESEVSIFIVPKTLLTISPNCYTPQHVALGPNHYWRPELHDMGEFKIAAAKRVQKQLQSQNLNFESLVEEFTEKHEGAIRACYQRFIHFEKEDLVWVMAVDSAFLLEFLQVIYSRQDQKKRKKAEIVSNKATSNVAVELSSTEVLTEANTVPAFTDVCTNDLYGRSTSTRNTIVRDMVMLENQIPLFLLREMLKYQCSSEELANNMLYEMLKTFRKKFCPFKSIKDLEMAAVSRRAHLLDYMYHTILPDDEPTSDVTCTLKDQSFKNKSGPFQNATAFINRVRSKIKQVQLPHVENKELPTGIKDSLDITKALVHVSQLNSEGSSVVSDGGSKKPPEIAIPSATELARVGVCSFTHQ